MTDSVLVTGAFGHVGSATLRFLESDGRRVVATDLDTAANRRAAQRASGAQLVWADLTDPAAVAHLVSTVKPSSIIHLAAVIPPFCYARRELAHAVNIDATAALVRAAEALSTPTRFVMTSSVAVYGPRNPYLVTDSVLTADSNLAPYDVYGACKFEAEKIVRKSSLDWVVLRLGGVLSAELRLDIDRNLLYFEALLPIDGRVHTVEVRDVARAVVAATTANVRGETLLIGGDASHRLRQGELAPATAAAMGLKGGLPSGRRGDPDSRENWFATDWMDTARAQEALGFQRHSWPDVLAETAERASWRRPLLRCAAPLVHAVLLRQSPYYHRPAGYADPWGAVADKWGDPLAHMAG